MLDSLLSQTCQEFVCYVHDDGSGDGTTKILAEYAASYPEQIILLEGEPTGSAKGNFLWMLGRVEADYYMFADQDDVWLPEKVEKSVKAYHELIGSRKEAADISAAGGATSAELRDDGKASAESQDDRSAVACIFTDMYVTDAALQITGNSFLNMLGRDIGNVLPGQILVDNPAAGCTMFFDRSLRDAVAAVLPGNESGLIDLAHISMHDQFILAAASLLGQVKGIDEPLVYYRQHDHNEMGAQQFVGGDRIRQNAGEILRGNATKSKKVFLQAAMEMAEELQKLPGLSCRQREFLKDLANVRTKYPHKLQRIAFYRKNHLERASRLRSWWMYLWV
jgi:rhamnosyltransferase